MKEYIKSSVDWGYFNKFEPLEDKYLPTYGEGDNMATQMVTAVCKLVYKWYNDGDVFDNTHGLEGWANDISSYANWLYQNIPGADDILINIEMCENDSDYENLLKDLADYCFDEEFLKTQSEMEKEGSIYNCPGPFKFVESSRDEDGYWEEDEDEDEDYWV